MVFFRPDDKKAAPPTLRAQVEPSERASASGKAFSMSERQRSGYPKALIDQLNGVITRCITENKLGALLILSIENLPMIMHAYGMEASEQIMRHVSDSIHEVVGKKDSVHRLQRDQFAIIIQELSPEEDVHYLTRRINSHIQQWCSDNDYGSMHVMSVMASIDLPSEARHANEALSKSYMALNDRSYGLTNIRSFRECQQEAAFSRQEMGLANYLIDAMKEDRLVMAYQPIVSAKNGGIVHYEALLRIRSDDGSVSSAGALIPVAERMGLIDEIDAMTLQMTVEKLAENPSVSMAFNISNLTTFSEAWMQQFIETIGKRPEVAPRLIVEITETAAQQDLDRIAYFVAEIQSLGCQVALDDFGSGYTSFRQLKTLSVDMVKIDGSFIKDLIDNADNQFFVKTLLDFTKGFGLPSVAEFVENGEIAKILMELGVEMMQGYYFGRPELGEPWARNQGSD